MKDDYLPQIPTLAEASASLELRSGSEWTLVRMLEHGLRASVWVDWSTDAPPQVFEGRTEGLLAELVFGGDDARLRAGAGEGLLTMTRRPSGTYVQFTPGLSFPLNELRFKRVELTHLAERNGWKGERKRGADGAERRCGAQDGTRTRTPPFGGRRILSPLCLPVSPPGRPGNYQRDAVAADIRRRIGQTGSGEVEARAGVEPTYTDLQSGA